MEDSGVNAIHRSGVMGSKGATKISPPSSWEFVGKHYLNWLSVLENLFLDSSEENRAMRIVLYSRVRDSRQMLSPFLPIQ